MPSSASVVGNDGEVLGPRSGRPGNEIGLRAVLLYHLAEEFPAQPHFQGQLGVHFPVVLKVSAVVRAMVVRPGKVRGKGGISAAHVVESAGHGGGYGREHQLSETGITA
jgi:hypothetical protein